MEINHPKEARLRSPSWLWQAVAGPGAPRGGKGRSGPAGGGWSGGPTGSGVLGDGFGEPLASSTWKWRTDWGGLGPARMQAGPCARLRPGCAGGRGLGSMEEQPPTSRRPCRFSSPAHFCLSYCPCFGARNAHCARWLAAPLRDGGLSVPTVPVPRLLGRPLAQRSVCAESSTRSPRALCLGRQGPSGRPALLLVSARLKDSSLLSGHLPRRLLGQLFPARLPFCTVPCASL